MYCQKLYGGFAPMKQCIFFIMYRKIKIQLLVSRKVIQVEIGNFFHDIYSNENMIINTVTKRINLYDSA